MAIALKRTRILAVAVLICIFYFAYSCSIFPAFPMLLHQETPDILAPVSLTNPQDFRILETEVLKDAHELISADEFLSHFRAVTQLPGITLEEAKLTCTWTEKDSIHFQYPDDEETWVRNERQDSELAARREEWQHFVNEEMLSWASAEARFTGRGIVIVAGNDKSVKRLHVILRALAKLQSTLSVEVHYWDDELGEGDKAYLTALWPDIEFYDLSDDINLVKTSYGIFTNYQLKTAAVVNSGFAEILLLDSDNVPVIDPNDLFETETYQEYGTIFWPDVTRTRPQNPIWAISNTRCRMDEYEQESGQLLVDKRRYFYHLQLAAWLSNNKSSYYNEFLLGDKDMFRFAWHMLKTPFGAPGKWVTSVGTNNDGYYCGHSFAQHHPNGSIAFLHGGLLKSMDLGVLQWNRDKKGGIFRDYKRSKYDERPELVERVGIKWDGGSYMPEGQKPQQIAHCMDMEDVESRDLEELLPGIEKFFDDIGGYWMV